MTKKIRRAGSGRGSRKSSSPPQPPTGEISAPATYTPGPWEAAKIYINRSDGSSDTHIATAATYDVGQIEACANARLIAAAPELLQLVREALQHFTDDQDATEAGPHLIDVRDWTKAAIAALANAEGR